MGGSQEAARCNADPPDVTGPLPTLQYLLEVEKDRLEVARRIEKERDIVFPETTIIIRDIIKLMEAIEGLERGAGATPAPVADDPEDDGLSRLIAELVDP